MCLGVVQNTVSMRHKFRNKTHVHLIEGKILTMRKYKFSYTICFIDADILDLAYGRET